MASSKTRSTMLERSDRFQTLTLLSLMLGLLVAEPAALARQTQRATNSATASAPMTVAGRVVNAMTGAPIARALVRMNNRAMLTNQEGKFQFDQVTESGVSIQLTKPGYSASPDLNEPSNLYYDLSHLQGPLELRLYPEAILSGTVTSPEGEPLGLIGLLAQRNTLDDLAQRWIIVGQAQTNVRGEFRIAAPAGDYRLTTRYMPRGYGGGSNGGDIGGNAILPVTVPAGGPGLGAAVIHLHHGEEQRVDLHPAVRRTYPVTVRLEGGTDRGFPMVQVRAANGTSFNVAAMPSSTPGVATVLLPAGSYTLTARMQGLDSVEMAETQVTVNPTDAPARDEATPRHIDAVLRFVATAGIPVELAVDPAATSDNASQGGIGSSRLSGAGGQPSPLQLGLSLVRVDAEDSYDGNASSTVPLLSVRNGPPSFYAPPGTYRLASRNFSPWFVQSASFGTSDLLTQNLEVAAGGTGVPLRLVVSNRTGGLRATITSKSGAMGSCWIYLIPSFASTTQLFVMRGTIGGDFHSQSMAPGTYQMIVFEHRRTVDLSKPATLAAFAGYVQTVTVTAGSEASVSLQVVPQAEVQP